MLQRVSTLKAFVRNCNGFNMPTVSKNTGRLQWPRRLRGKTAVARLLGFWVGIPPRSIDDCCEYCGLSGRDLCMEMITRPEESYLVGVFEYDRETSTVKTPWPNGGCCVLI
jgi:hypothetical protein